jgi:hypothetical protein
VPIAKKYHEELRAAVAEPELMAIGDSLFNGTQSLTTRRDFAEQAAPAVVARALGAKFVAPDYPRPVLFDIIEFLNEDWTLWTPQESIDRLLAKIVKNAVAWQDDAPELSTRKFFDNAAIAQAAVSNLWQDKAGVWRGRIPGLLQKVKDGQLGAIPDLYYAINASFILNPSGHAGLDNCTPLELVAFRRPKRLLVSIGSNEGLFMGCFLGRYDQKAIDGIKGLPAQMRELAGRMEALFVDAGIEQVVINLLTKPSAVPNVMPNIKEAVPDCGSYYSKYESNLLAQGPITRAQMRRFDRDVAAANEATRGIFKAAFKGYGSKRPQVLFADLFKASADQDNKHGCHVDAVRVKIKDGGSNRTLGNYPLGFPTGFGTGLCSLDNMHPSTTGYALMAEAILAAMGKKPPGSRTAFFQQAFDTGRHIHPVPPEWYSFKIVLRLAGGLGLFNGF